MSHKRQYHYGLQLITPPAESPLTLEEAKAHLRVVSTDEDVYIQTLIDAVTASIDGRTGWLGRQLVEATWQLVLDNFPENEILLYLPPLMDVLSVQYFNENGDFVTMDAQNYEIDTKSYMGWILPVTGVGWPATMETINAIEITYKAGYGTAGQVPAAIKAAMKLMIGTLFENREDVVIGTISSKLPDAVEMLLMPYRVVSYV